MVPQWGKVISVFSKSHLREQSNFLGMSLLVLLVWNCATSESALRYSSMRWEDTSDLPSGSLHEMEQLEGAYLDFTKGEPTRKVAVAFLEDKCKAKSHYHCYFLGLLFFHSKNFGESKTWSSEAVAISPKSGDYHSLFSRVSSEKVLAENQDSSNANQFSIDSRLQKSSETSLENQLKSYETLLQICKTKSAQANMQKMELSKQLVDANLLTKETFQSPSFQNCYSQEELASLLKTAKKNPKNWEKELVAEKVKAHEFFGIWDLQYFFQNSKDNPVETNFDLTKTWMEIIRLGKAGDYVRAKNKWAIFQKILESSAEQYRRKSIVLKKAAVFYLRSNPQLKPIVDSEL